MDISERTLTVEEGGIVHTTFPPGTEVTVAESHAARMRRLFEEIDRERGDRPRMTAAEIDTFLASERASWE